MKKNKNWKIIIDQEKCIGCGTCVALVPEVFEMGKNGKAKAKNPLAQNLKKIKLAEKSCPVQAIKIWENSKK